MQDYSLELLTDAQPQGDSPARQPEVIAFPASFAQKRLWLLEQLDSGTPLYNISSTLRIPGDLDVAALERALNEVVRRHEVLRTTFALLDGQLMQLISPELTLRLPLIDLTGLGAEWAAREAESIGQAEASRTFDLARGPLIRWLLIRAASDEHVLLLTMHHIVSDAWSMSVFSHELSLLYAAFSRGEATPLAELPIQYADYAEWQRDWLQGEELERQTAYWREYLNNGEVPALELSSLPRSTAATYRGAHETLLLDDHLSGRLQEMGRREGVTLFMLLLAVYQVLIYRYTGQREITVGTPVANRNHKEIEGLIGFFVNTLVLKGEIEGSQSFRELLRKTREAALGAYAHQDMPFEKLVELLQPERDMDHSPLFRLMFVLQNVPEVAFKINGVTCELKPIPNEAAKFDLSLAVEESPDGLKVTCGYKTELFTAATIRRLLRHYETLLRAVVADADKRVDALPLLTEVERRLLLDEWNDTRQTFSSGGRLHELFEEQAEQTPAATAVVFGDERLSYAELNERANRLAHYLRGQGVGPDVLVGVLMERSVELVVCLLGVLKAGGGYVPLDPNHPQQRLKVVLDDARVHTLLTQEQPPEGLLPLGTRLVRLDAERATISAQPKQNVAGGPAADNAAYVIYTSGSTGKPKGVVVSHRSVRNLIEYTRRHFGLSQGDVLLSVTNPSFDIACVDIFLPLSSGALTEIVSYDVAADGARLAAKVAGSGVTIMQGTPATWQLLLDAKWAGDDRLTAISTGEAISRDLAERLLTKCGLLWNLYGPTETTIWSTVYLINSVDGSVPIGQPVANTDVYILDARLQPVPVGVAGELYIGGEGLARGYLKNPRRTAESFLPHPFSREPGRRLYRTGDVVRYLEDGNIEFHGRGDYQVKIRGHRIELGEIEATLDELPGVRQSVVVAQGEGVEKRLVGYVVPKAGESLSVGELRAALRHKLPEYMVPSVLMQLAEMPLTSNGKVNRRALPEAPEAREEAAPEQEPRTELEKTLADIWKEVLKLDKVGIHENFFDLGGHSLLATRIIALVTSTLGVKLPLRAVFNSPTIADLALAIGKGQARTGAAGP